MSVEIVIVNNLDEIDFDALFEGSYPQIDDSFAWPGLTTLEEKKLYYRSQLESAIAGTWVLTNPNERLFMFKGIYNGVVMEFVAGYVEQDNETLRVHWCLTRPNDNGSKNEIYIEPTRRVRTAFYNSNGLYYYKTPTIKYSMFYRWVMYRHNSGMDSEYIVEQYPTFPGISSLEDYITFKLKA
jgi:hypothetical protein